MAKRKKKQRVVNITNENMSLKVAESTSILNNVEYLPGLYDVSNSRLAKEHYLTYVMRPIKSDLISGHSRFYLSKSNKYEFFQNKQTSTQKNYLLDDYPNQYNLIREFLILVFGAPAPDKISSWPGSRVFIGLKYFLDYIDLNLTEEKINRLEDINEQTQHAFYIYSEKKPLNNTELRDSYHFFSALSKATGKFKARDMSKRMSTPALPTPVIYKLDYYSRKAIEESLAIYNTYSEVLEQAREFNNLFTLQNLLATRYSITNNKRGSFLKNLDLLIKSKYGIESKLWNKRKGEKYSYPTKEAEKNHKELIGISKNGTDIYPHDLPSKLWWFFELYPNWPQNSKINPIYDGVFNGNVFSVIKTLGLNLDELNIYFRPQIEVIYPLFLLLQIRTGKNTQPLTDLKIEKTANEKYTLGLKHEDGGRKIFSVKSRTNTEDYIFLHTDKEINNYIETFLKWFGPIVYQQSKYQNFFQGHGRTSKTITFLTPGKRKYASIKFLKKYKIFDHEDNKRLDSINHKRLRSSYVGASYLRGLKEYETQHLLRHDSGTTQHLHYSNHVEVKKHKLRKLAWAQRKIVDLFKGIIVSIADKTLILGKGVLSDCADPKNPTHDQKPKLNSSESCSDWMFCLLCEKSRVLKELHGPVIIAMKRLLQELEEIMPTREWEKEYGDIYDSIESALLRYSDEEKEEYGKNAYKHRTLCENAIYMKRKRKDITGAQREHKTV